MSDPGAPESGSRAGSGLKWAFAASLALNLLLAGAIAGAVFFGPFHKRPHGGRYSEEFGLMGFSRTLPPERRDMIRKTLREERPKLRDLRDGVRAARADFARSLTAEPFDKAKVRAAIEGLDAADRRLRTSGVDVFLQSVERLTPEERKSLTAWWQSKRPHMFPRPPGKKRGENDDLPGPPEKD